eukprot:CAMPEP_0170287704 /NCGR_PEP_ID=MMETSP0116_2-20130129/43909_1 /TAXON_ID=400756 /ORGANISM="Durinskia baltica, Strain CSIRO CS-38" /LENGTH=35 /DNA_ID= /DNA_START= /DNA_END= /DNA_ORIENTATION=
MAFMTCAAFIAFAFMTFTAACFMATAMSGGGQTEG